MFIVRIFPLFGLLLFFGGLFLPHHNFSQFNFYLLCASIIFSGWQIFHSACFNLIQKRVNASVLITIAILSLISLNLIFQAALYTCLIGLLTYLQESSADILLTKLKNKWPSLPPSTQKLTSQQTEQVTAGEISKQDLLVITPHELVPVDSIIKEGSAKTKPSLVGQEVLSSCVREGDFLPAGTQVLEGKLIVEAQENQANSLNILSLASFEKSVSSKKFIETSHYNQSWARRILIFIFCMALPFFFFAPSLLTWLTYSITVLLLFAPYTSVIESASLLSARNVYQGLRYGTFSQDPLNIADIAEAKAVVFEKISAISNGKLILANLHAPYPFSRSQILQIAASITKEANHPLAASIAADAAEFGLSTDMPAIIRESCEFNIQGTVEGIPVLVGENSFLESHGVKTTILLRKYAEYLNQGASVLFVAIDGQAAGLISFVKEIHPHTFTMLAQIQAAGIKHTVLLAQDKSSTGLSANKTYGFTEALNISEPAAKAPAMQKLHFSYQKIILVGQAPKDQMLMEQADLSIAVQAGKNLSAALQTADLLIIGNYFKALPKLISLSKSSERLLNSYKKIVFWGKLILMLLVLIQYFTLWQAVLLDGLLGLFFIFNSYKFAQKS